MSDQKDPTEPKELNLESEELSEDEMDVVAGGRSNEQNDKRSAEESGK